jgi:hypothetical protein
MDSVLSHLLEVENTASKIVIDARAKAEQRLAGNERTLREWYDAEFAKQYADLEDCCNKKISTIDADYNQKLEACRKEQMSINQDAFSRLAEKLLMQEA